MAEEGFGGFEKYQDAYQGSYQRPSGGGAPASITGAGKISSLEAFGAPIISPVVATTGIVTSEAVGQPAISPSIASTGIPSQEAVNGSVISATVNSTGIPTSEAAGAPIIGATISTTGIASLEAVGAPSVIAEIDAAAIDSAEAFGQPTVSTGVTPQDITDAGGIDSAEAFGQPIVSTRIPFYGGASSKKPRALTYGDLMDMWEAENRRIQELEREEAASLTITKLQAATTADQQEAETLTVRIAQARRRLAELEQARRDAEVSAQLSRMQAEALAREARAQQAVIDELEEEEAIAMAMIALML